jgi:hypothetical protein
VRDTVKFLNYSKLPTHFTNTTMEVFVVGVGASSLETTLLNGVGHYINGTRRRINIPDNYLELLDEKSDNIATLLLSQFNTDDYSNDKRIFFRVKICTYCKRYKRQMNFSIDGAINTVGFIDILEWSGVVIDDVVNCIITTTDLVVSIFHRRCTYKVKSKFVNFNN